MWFCHSPVTECFYITDLQDDLRDDLFRSPWWNTWTHKVMIRELQSMCSGCWTMWLSQCWKVCGLCVNHRERNHITDTIVLSYSGEVYFLKNAAFNSFAFTCWRRTVDSTRTNIFASLGSFLTCNIKTGSVFVLSCPHFFSVVVWVNHVPITIWNNQMN